MRNYFRGPQKPFFYRLANQNYNLDEIKHGLLRNNKKAPEAFLACLGSTDDRRNLLDGVADPRINFICLDSPCYVEHIDPIDGSSSEYLSKSINDYVGEYLNAKVTIDLENAEIMLPALMETYRKDFGSGTDSDLMSFVFPYLEDSDYDVDSILMQIEEKTLAITFE